jgi:hypothetical protein
MRGVQGVALTAAVWATRASQDGWPSGLRRTPGKRVYVKAYREFESRPIRQPRLTLRRQAGRCHFGELASGVRSWCPFAADFRQVRSPRDHRTRPESELHRGGIDMRTRAHVRVREPTAPLRPRVAVRRAHHLAGVERYGSFELVVEHQERRYFGRLCVTFVFGLRRTPDDGRSAIAHDARDAAHRRSEEFRGQLHRSLRMSINDPGARHAFVRDRGRLLFRHSPPPCSMSRPASGAHSP